MTFFRHQIFPLFSHFPPSHSDRKGALNLQTAQKFPDNMFLMFPLFDLPMYFTLAKGKKNIFIRGNALMERVSLLEVIYI